jgi:drug/metabolite transporter (DMT)-like permease
MAVKGNYLAGVGLGLLGAAGSATVAIILSGEPQIPTNWVLLVQSSVALLVSCLLAVTTVPAVPDQVRAGLRTSRYPKHLLRALAGLAIYAFYYRSLKLVPKVDCSLLLNTAPLFVPITCVVAFGDRVRFCVWAGIVVGFAGVAVVLTPEGHLTSPELGHLLALLGGVSFAVATVLLRDLNCTEPVTRTVFYYHAHSVACLLVVAVVSQQGIGWRDLAVCGAVGLVFCMKQYALTYSVKLASAPSAAMLNFAAIPLLALYGVVTEGKGLTASLLLGAVLVTVGSLVVILGGQPPQLGRPEPDCSRLPTGSAAKLSDPSAGSLLCRNPPGDPAT